MLRAQTPAHLCPQDNRFSSEWPINPGSAVALRRSVVRFRFDVPPTRVLYKLHYLTPRIARRIVARRRQTRTLYVYRALRSRDAPVVYISQILLTKEILSRIVRFVK